MTDKNWESNHCCDKDKRNQFRAAMSEISVGLSDFVDLHSVVLPPFALCQQNDLTRCQYKLGDLTKTSYKLH